MSKINGIITAFEYDNSESFNFAPLRELAINAEGSIDISIFIIIETDDCSKRTFSINLLCAKDTPDSKAWNVSSLLLQGFTIGSEDIDNVKQVRNVTGLLPNMNLHRHYAKFNIKNIPITGGGKYVLLLNELSEEDIRINPERVADEFLSCYPIEIKEHCV